MPYIKLRTNGEFWGCHFSILGKHVGTTTISWFVEFFQSSHLFLMGAQCPAQQQNLHEAVCSHAEISSCASWLFFKHTRSFPNRNQNPKSHANNCFWMFLAMVFTLKEAGPFRWHHFAAIHTWNYIESPMKKSRFRGAFFATTELWSLIIVMVCDGKVLPNRPNPN